LKQRKVLTFSHWTYIARSRVELILTRAAEFKHYIEADHFIRRSADRALFSRSIHGVRDHFDGIDIQLVDLFVRVIVNARDRRQAFFFEEEFRKRWSCAAPQ